MGVHARWEFLVRDRNMSKEGHRERDRELFKKLGKIS